MGIVVLIALAQGIALRLLHALAESDLPPWSELIVLLPVYAVVVGVPLTWFLLRRRLSVRSLAMVLLLVGAVLAATAAWVGWVNGPVGELRPASESSVFLYAALIVLAWFVALPFLILGIRGSFTAAGYAALFDESWRLAITLAFSALFLLLFWLLLSLFASIFESIGIEWLGKLIYHENFAYPATCIAASFAIGITEVRPEMFRSLRRLLLVLLRWLTVLAAFVVISFLAAVAVQGVGVLWSTRHAALGLISVSVVLITLYNTVYEDGLTHAPLPGSLDWLVRAALVAAPLLAGLALWALRIRIAEYGISEDRLQAVIFVVIIGGYLLGYAVVAITGTAAPFAIRHVNVVMALAIIATIIVLHTPLVDLKRIACAAQRARVATQSDVHDLHYLRFDVGRYGLEALAELRTSSNEHVARVAERALGAPNGPQPGHANEKFTRDEFRTRIQVTPTGKELPAGLIDKWYSGYLAGGFAPYCIESTEGCLALFMDLDGDGRDEVVLDLQHSRRVFTDSGGWIAVGHLSSDAGRRFDLETNKIEARSPTRFGSISIGAEGLPFEPCRVDDADCDTPPK